LSTLELAQPRGERSLGMLPRFVPSSATDAALAASRYAFERLRRTPLLWFELVSFTAAVFRRLRLPRESLFVRGARRFILLFEHRAPRLVRFRDSLGLTRTADFSEDRKSTRL